MWVVPRVLFIGIRPGQTMCLCGLFCFFRSLYRGKEDTVYSAMEVRRRTL